MKPVDSMVALLPNTRSGIHSSWSFVRSIASQEIELPTHRRYFINTDGEITTSTLARFRVNPKAIAVLVP